MMTDGLTCFFPSSRIRENSLFSVKRFFLLVVCFNGTLPSALPLLHQQRSGRDSGGLDPYRVDQARASLFLPLALRLLRTLRPPRVAILARKPHLCAFLILEGWKVLFMMFFLSPVDRNIFMVAISISVMK